MINNPPPSKDPFYNPYEGEGVYQSGVGVTKNIQSSQEGGYMLFQVCLGQGVGGPA